MAVNAADTETQLITYLKNILKYQIIPMDCMNLRDLVKEAPKNMQLFEFIEEKYPGTQFMDFIKKYPDIFAVDSSRSVVLSEGNNFTLPYAAAAKLSDQVDGCDVVDGYDRAEYISDSDSESSGTEGDNLLKKEDRPKRAADRPSVTSSDSESSIEIFSSELVHTSDSNQSSLTSSSSNED